MVMARKVVELEMPDGRVVRRLVKVCRPDQRRPDHANRLHAGHVSAPVCRRCGQPDHRAGGCVG
jgi:hypothetical protein